MVTYSYCMATNTDTSKAVARAVSAALREAGIAQRDAASRTGIPTTTLSRRLTGHSPFNLNELELLANLTGRTVSDFVPRSAA